MAIYGIRFYQIKDPRPLDGCTRLPRRRCGARSTWSVLWTQTNGTREPRVLSKRMCDAHAKLFASKNGVQLEEWKKPVDLAADPPELDEGWMLDESRGDGSPPAPEEREWDGFADVDGEEKAPW